MILWALGTFASPFYLLYLRLQLASDIHHRTILTYNTYMNEYCNNKVNNKFIKRSASSSMHTFWFSLLIIYTIRIITLWRFFLRHPISIYSGVWLPWSAVAVFLIICGVIFKIENTHTHTHKSIALSFIYIY